MFDPDSLRRDGYTLLRGAIPADWLEGLREAFDAGVRPSHEWPVPRGADWRHAMLDLDPRVLAVCRLPVLLAAAGALIGYFAESRRAAHLATASLRNVRMETGETFDA